jgi:hypothetical protein
LYLIPIYFVLKRGDTMDIEKIKKRIRNEAKALLIEIDNDDLGDIIEAADRAIISARNFIRANIDKPKDFPIDAISLGDHLMVDMPLYTHHGIYIGNREVAHFDKGHIHTISLEEFLGDLHWEIVDSVVIYDIDEVIERALSRIGEIDYNLVFNNCEHFVRWCRSGSRYSKAI